MPVRAGCRPDTQTLPGTGLEHLWQHAALQHLERIGIPEPQRFVGRHRVDNRFAQTAAWLRLNLSDQITKRLDALLFHQLVQAAGYQILLVAAQQDAACLFKKYPELLEIQID